MKYKYFLFDWDGSLGNSLPLWFSAFKTVFSEFGVKVPDLVIGEKVIGDWEGPARVGIKDQDAFFRRMEEILLPQLPEVDLNPGAKDLLMTIKEEGGKIAVVTTSKREYVEPALEKNGIKSMIDVFLGKEDVQKYKPDPEQLIKALEIMGGEADETIMTGDTKHDIQAAKNGGIDSALYYPVPYEEYYDKERQERLGATYIIKNFTELQKFI